MSQENCHPFPIPAVSLIENRPSTTSLAIAEHFGKRHCDVMRDIQNLVENCPEDFHKRNFALMSRKVKIGNGAEREEPYYVVFFDGFILLVMGYTGPKALKMKLAYIDAFNAMRAKIESKKGIDGNLPLTPEMQKALQAIVKAKLDPYELSRQQFRGWSAQLFIQLNHKFGVRRYRDLPQSKLAEAVAFLANLEIAPKKLTPPLEPEREVRYDAVTTPKEYPANMRINRKLALENLEKMRNEIDAAFSAIRDMVHYGCHPGKTMPHMKPDESTAYKILNDLYMGTIDSIDAAQNSLDAGYRLGVLVGRE